MDMQNPVIDVAEAEANHAAHEARRSQLLETGQKIFARIRKSSKYYGQGGKDKLLNVVITKDHYAVQCAGNQYRLIDVDLFVAFVEGDENPVQITFETVVS